MQGQPVPDFSLSSTGGMIFSLSSTRRSKVVLYPQFKRAGAELFGISRDSLKSHQRFKKVRGIPNGWRGVKVPGHAQEVLNFVKAL